MSMNGKSCLIPIMFTSVILRPALLTIWERSLMLLMMTTVTMEVASFTMTSSELGKERSSSQ